MPYSPEIHPLPELRRNTGTDSSTDAVQMTRVLPISIKAEPSAVEMKSGMMLTGRIWSGARLSLRKIIGEILTVWGLPPQCDIGSLQLSAVSQQPSAISSPP